MSTEIFRDRTIIDGANALVETYKMWESQPNTYSKQETSLRFGNRVLKLEMDKSVLHRLREAGVSEEWKNWKIQLKDTGEQLFYARFSIHNCGMDEYALFSSVIRDAGVKIPISGHNLDAFYDGIFPRQVNAKNGTSFRDVSSDSHHLSSFGPSETLGLAGRTDRFRVKEGVAFHTINVAGSLENLKLYSNHLKRCPPSSLANENSPKLDFTPEEKTEQQERMQSLAMRILDLDSCEQRDETSKTMDQVDPIAGVVFSISNSG